MIIVIMKNTTIDPVFKTISYSCLLVYWINSCYPHTIYMKQPTINKDNPKTPHFASSNPKNNDTQILNYSASFYFT